MNKEKSEELKKIIEIEKKAAKKIAETIFDNLDKVLEQISDENFLKELAKRIKEKKIKIDFDYEQTAEERRIRYLLAKDYKLDLLEIWWNNCKLAI